MGFYLELVPEPTKREEFREVPPPKTYWILYAIAVFAVGCMMAAAYQVLGDLLSAGTVWDLLILGILALVILLFGAVGFKMAALRRFIRVAGTQLQTGYFCFGYPLVLRKVNREDVKEVVLLNQKPAPNLAPQFHDDPQYFIRGHWRVVVYSNHHPPLLIDKHVEKEALESIYQWVSEWWKSV
jgi:hypothetical protein